MRLLFLTLTLTLTLTLLPLTHASPARTLSFSRYSGGPSSCTSSTQCAPNFFCDSAGVCAKTQSGLLPPLPLLPTYATVLLALASGLAAGGLLAVLWVCALLRPCRRHNNNRIGFFDYMEILSFHVMFWVLVISLAVGIGVGMATKLHSPPQPPSQTTPHLPPFHPPACDSLTSTSCDPYYCDMRTRGCFSQCKQDADCAATHAKCNTETNQCVVPKVSKALLSPGYIAALSILGPIGFGFTCLLFCVIAAPDGGGWFYGGIICTLLLTFAAYIVVPVSLTQITLHPPVILPGPNGNVSSPLAVPCQGNRVCYPYRCDIGGSHLCYEMCASDFDCTLGSHCDLPSSSCVPDVPVKATPLSVGWSIVVAIIVAAIAACAAAAAADRFGFGFEPDTEDIAIPCATWVCIVVALVVALPLCLVYSPFVPKEPGTGETCVMPRAAACSPYYCDTRAKSCFTTCQSDDHCVKGVDCIDGQCRAKAHAKLQVPILSPTKTAAAVGGVFLGVALIATLGYCYFGAEVYTDNFLDFRHDEWDVLDIYAVPCVSIPAMCATLSSAFLLTVLLLASKNHEFYGPLAPHPPHGNATFPGTPCVHPTDLSCAPYLCHSDFGRCTTSCQAPEDCISGYACDASGSCVPGNPRLPLPPALSSGVICILSLSMWLIVCALSKLVCGTRARRENERPMLFHEDWIGPRFLATYWFAIIMFVAVIAPLAVYFRYGTELQSPRVDGTTGRTGLFNVTCNVIDDVRCGQHVCDMELQTCYTACVSSWQCQENAYCSSSSKTCKPHSSVGVWLGFGALLLPILGVLSYVFIAPKVRSVLADRRRRRREAEEAQRQALLQQHREHMANVEEATINVGVPESRAWDPTIPTPLGAHTGFGPAFVFPDDPEDPANPEGQDSSDPVVSGAGVGSGSPAPATAASLDTPGSQALAGERMFAHTDSTCSVCMFAEATVRLVGRECKHGFCAECARYSLEAILNDSQFPAQCPGCRAEGVVDRGWIPSGVIEFLVRRTVLAIETGRRFIRQQILQAEGETGITCPACSMISIRPGPGNSYVPKAHPVRSRQLRQLAVECTGCGTAFCMACTELWFDHDGLSCEDAADLKARNMNPSALAATEELMAGSKACPNCGMAGIKAYGHACHHISPGTGCLSCGFHWCFVSGLPYSDCQHEQHGHSLFCDFRCGCPLCQDCQPGRPCFLCNGNCPVCAPEAHIDLLVARGLYNPPAPTPAAPPPVVPAPVPAPIPPPLPIQEDEEEDEEDGPQFMVVPRVAFLEEIRRASDRRRMVVAPGSADSISSTSTTVSDLSDRSDDTGSDGGGDVLARRRGLRRFQLDMTNVVGDGNVVGGGNDGDGDERVDAAAEQRVSAMYAPRSAVTQRVVALASPTGMTGPRSAVQMTGVDGGGVGEYEVRTPAHEHGDRVAQFCEITGVEDEEEARNYLAMFNWRVDSAVFYFLEEEERRRTGGGEFDMGVVIDRADEVLAGPSRRVHSFSQ